MQILMTGTDHGKAPVEIRERFAFTSKEKQAFMSMLALLPAYDGCVILNTCNRTEVWVSSREDCVNDLQERLCAFKELNPEEYRDYFVSRSGMEAVSYLFELASGLRSLIVGEDQILAQVKNAAAEAHEAGCIGSVLDVLFRSAVTGAKKVKTDLSISTANASAVDYAIQTLTESGMDFRNKNCLVIGNGEMGKRTATALLALGADVTVTIRQYRSGIVEVVPGCRRINYAERYQVIPQCDIVVSATSSPNVTLTREELAANGYRSGTVFIDLAVPRDMEPEIRSLPDVQLMDIDSFSVPRTEELRCQLEQAEEMLNEQKARFVNWVECRDLLPKVDEIGDRFADAMLLRMGSVLKKLDDSSREAVVDAARDAAQKEIKKVIFSVRDEAGIETFRAMLDALDGAEK